MQWIILSDLQLFCQVLPICFLCDATRHRTGTELGSGTLGSEWVPTMSTRFGFGYHRGEHIPQADMLKALTSLLSSEL
jgi:hypothetical protein